MSDKILEAVKALGGDVSNTWHYKGDESLLALCDDGDYLCVYDEDEILSDTKYICTTSEFNTAAAEWLKEAYMHNAAIDLEWDVTNACEHVASDKHLVIYKGRYVTRQSLESSPSLSPYMPISTTQEFIDYCAENKPNPKPVFTQAMADAGELPSVGCECTLRYMHDSKTVTHTGLVLYASRKYCILDHVGYEILCKIGDYAYEPIKSPRDKFVEKLRKDLVAADYPCNLLYDWLKSLTPEQRKEFDL